MLSENSSSYASLAELAGGTPFQMFLCPIFADFGAMNFPTELLGRYVCEISVRAYDAHPNGTLVKKEENYAYHKSQSFASRLTFLAVEGEAIWIDVDDSHCKEDPLLMVCRLINGSVHLTPLSFKEWGAVRSASEWTFDMGDQCSLNIKWTADGERLCMTYVTVFDSRLDDGVSIRLTWDMEYVMQCQGECAPNNYVQDDSEPSVKAIGSPPLDKRGKKVQCCTSCRRPRRGHVGPLGPKCSMASQ